MSNFFRIYAESDPIYYGNFSEVPSEHREKIVEALNNWGEILGKGGLNEMIYSLFFWYNQKEFICSKCEKTFKEDSLCSICGQQLSESDKYEHNEIIDNLLNSVGMLTRLEIV